MLFLPCFSFLGATLGYPGLTPQLPNELCYSSSASRNEFPISSSVCSASLVLHVTRSFRVGDAFEADRVGP